MRVAVFGSGGHGKVVGDAIWAAQEHDLVGFLDDNPNMAKRTIGKTPIFVASGNLRDLIRQQRIEGVALGVGDNEARERILERCRRAGLAVVRAIHPAATLAPSVEKGEGIAAFAGSVVNPFARLGEGAVVNTSASVDHDCNIHRFVHLWPGARLAGNVEVGEFSYIGMGASVIQNVSIGKRVTVGAGAVVLADLEDDITAVGAPAKKVEAPRTGRGG